MCGFSERLILWIGNILKWVKYIMPVILFGILDFIKAIAAALVFLIPLIIEFVLNKMGFEANGCVIIDL